MLRLTREKGTFKMMVSVAAAKKRDDLLPTKEYWPHAFIDLGSREAIERFLRNVNSNHLHFTYGNYAKELQYIAQLLNIELIAV